MNTLFLRIIFQHLLQLVGEVVLRQGVAFGTDAVEEGQRLLVAVGNEDNHVRPLL